MSGVSWVCSGDARKKEELNTTKEEEKERRDVY